MVGRDVFPPFQDRRSDRGPLFGLSLRRSRDRAACERRDRVPRYHWRKRAEAEARENDRRYRQIQIELAHANRVATMGQLTASIAHEVNQPITAMVTNA